jgi:hypothetical protein
MSDDKHDLFLLHSWCFGNEVEELIGPFAAVWSE